MDENCEFIHNKGNFICGLHYDKQLSINLDSCDMNKYC